MAFSKYEPDRPDEGNAFDASSPSAARRAKILRWANWLVLVYTALGFGLIAYWLVQ